VSGLLPARAGTISVSGIDVTGVPPQGLVRHGVVHIPQGDLLFPDMTVEENLLMGADPTHAWRHRAARLDEVTTFFPRLGELPRQRARTLSGGERRMLALGRGLMADARLLMIDEPSLGLAPVLVDEVYAKLAEIRARGLTILLVEENFSHVTSLADHVCLLESGRIVRDGPADALLADPALTSTISGCSHARLVPPGGCERPDPGLHLRRHDGGPDPHLRRAPGPQPGARHADDDRRVRGLGVATVAGLPPLVGAAAAFVVAFGLGVVIYRVAVAPLSGHREFELVGFISTLAVAMILQNAMLVVFGARNKPVDPILGGSLPLPFQITVTWHQVVVAAVAILVLVLLQLFLTRSRHGLAVVAVAQYLDAARLMGVDARRIHATTMGLSAGLAAIAGVLLAPLFIVSPNAGDLPLLKAIIVAIFGGMGSIRGTIVAAFVIGLVEALASLYLGAKFALPALVAVVFVTLTIRPNGLFGLSQESRL
jgi:ABC-type branched-subunit amino acid transport system ATPase component/branched-subunit amino acid ABC-type transport system permease component